MKSNFKLTTPIIYLVFNRLDHVKRTFPEIRKAKPSRLFIGADGPRTKIEKKKTEAVRKYILENIDWTCEVKTLFRKENLGCEKAVSEALDWFFDNVEYGIVLEDDCLADQSFFRYCQELLEKYKDNPRVMSLSAQSPVKILNGKSYDFVRVLHLWGWASWKRVWKNIYWQEEKYLQSKNPEEYIREVFPRFFERPLFKKRFFDYVTGNANTWEFPIVFGIIRSRGLNIFPRLNLVENIGFEDGFTNTKPNFVDKKFLNLKRSSLNFPLKHPKKIKMNEFICWKITFRDFLRVFLKKILFL
jgi:hypothetical protein